MAQQDPNQIATDWANRLAGATDKITRGVQSVSVPPGQAAAAQKSVYIQNVQASADKWARNVASVSLGDWQTAMTGKGVQRVAQGAQAAQPKFAQFMSRLIPFINSGRGSLPARGNLEANIARSAAWARYMSTFKNR